jgi:signal transduction histidine kinase
MGLLLLISLLLSYLLSGLINRRLRHYENQLHASNEKLLFQSRQALIGELMPMIAHQWRQPLNKIASVLALIRFDISQKKCDPYTIDKACEDMEESVDFMSETIDDFRTFYRPKNEIEDVDLAQLVTRAIAYVGSAIRSKNIELTTQLRSAHYRLYANEFLQVMINLIKNAVDASEPGGKIEVLLYEEERVVQIVVIDYGEGIAPEAIQKIFEPYYSTKENSMGLGLYMTKMIIEKHMNGSITASSDAREGTRFIIQLYRI